MLRVPVLDGISAFNSVSAFRRPSLPLFPIVPLLVSLFQMAHPPSRGSCLPLSPIAPLLASLCCMVSPPSWGLVSFCLPLSHSLSSVLSPSLSLFLFPFVAGGFILHCPPSSVRLGVLSAFSCVRSCSWKDFLNPPTVWGLRRRNVLQVSRARSHLAQRYNVEQKDNNRNVKMCSARSNRNNAWPMPMARC